MATIPASENVFPLVRMAEVAAPSTPPTGEVHLYAKSDGLLYWKDDAGTEYPVGAAAAHIADTSDAHDASAISVADAGNLLTATDVEAALAEIIGMSGGGALDDLSDVDAPSPGTGEVLTFDGADWVAQAPSGGTADPTIPAGGTLYTFDSALSGWTTIGTPDVSTAEYMDDLYRIQEASTGASHLYAIHRALPGSLPRTITCRVEDALLAAQYHGAAIVIGDGTSYFTLGTLFESTDQHLTRRLWPTATTQTTSANYTGQGRAGFPIWLRIVISSSSSVDLLYSKNGRVYNTLATAVNPGAGTISNFGLGIYAFGVSAEGVFKWLHST